MESEGTKAQKSIERSADQTKQAAKHTAAAAQVTMTSAERALQISADQLVLANERTYAAWVRTGLVSLASGLGADQLLARYVSKWMALGTVSILVLFSAFCFVAGVWRHLFPGATPPEPNVRRMPTLVLVAVNGFLAIVAAAALVAVWSPHVAGR